MSKRILRQIGFAVLLALPAAAQTMQVRATTPSAGVTELALSMDSPAGREVVTMQWEWVVPAHSFTPDPAGPQVGPAAVASGESLYCTGHWVKAPHTYGYRCILAGSDKAIGNGTLAVLRFRTSRTAKPGEYKVQVHKARALTMDRKRVSLKDCSGSMTLTPRTE